MISAKILITSAVLCKSCIFEDIESPILFIIRRKINSIGNPMSSNTQDLESTVGDIRIVAEKLLKNHMQLLADQRQAVDSFEAHALEKKAENTS